MLLTSSIFNFLTIQFLLTKNKYLFSSLVISKIAAISSPFCKLSKLITGCPLAVLAVSGISYAGIVNTLHFVVKNNKSA